MNESSNHDFSQLFQNALQFYALYLSKITLISERSKTIQLIVENVTTLFDLNQSESGDEPVSTFGSQLCLQLFFSSNKSKFKSYYFKCNEIIAWFKVIVPNKLH